MLFKRLTQISHQLGRGGVGHGQDKRISGLTGNEVLRHQGRLQLVECGSHIGPKQQGKWGGCDAMAIAPNQVVPKRFSQPPK